jgi:hypothetical protein
MPLAAMPRGVFGGVEQAAERRADARASAARERVFIGSGMSETVF